MSLKAKTEAIKNLVEIEGMVGQQKIDSEAHELEKMNFAQEVNEDREKMDAKQTSQSNEFLAQLLGQLGQGGQPGAQQGEQGQQQQPG
jgi:hypothetical protein